MRAVHIVQSAPWPSTDGTRLRNAAVARALSRVADLHMVSLGVAGVAATDEESAALAHGVERFFQVPVPPSRAATPVARWVRSGRPRRLLPFETPEVRAGFASLAGSGLGIGGYDVVWLSSAYVAAAAPDGLGRRVVLDLDDDQRELLRAARRARPAVGTEAGVRDRATVWARWGTAQVANAVDARRWDGVYDAAFAAADAVVVCSEDDRRRLHHRRMAVVPNGYELAGRATSDRSPRPGVAVFVGLMSYEPNRDAAVWVAREVWPKVRAGRPDAVLRLVGRNADAVAELADCPGVEVVGEVDDVADELRAAALAVVPIRFGGGTRLKVVEAMANRVPMVSTTLGCEGIDVRNGEHLLIADRSADFAAACERLFADAALADRLAAAAAARFEERYRWSTIEAGIGELVADLAR